MPSAESSSYELFEKAVSSMNDAETVASHDYGRRKVRESKQWLLLAQHKLAVETMEAAMKGF